MNDLHVEGGGEEIQLGAELLRSIGFQSAQLDPRAVGVFPEPTEERRLLGSYFARNLRAAGFHRQIAQFPSPGHLGRQAHGTCADVYRHSALTDPSAAGLFQSLLPGRPPALGRIGLHPRRSLQPVRQEQSD